MDILDILIMLLLIILAYTLLPKLNTNSVEKLESVGPVIQLRQPLEQFVKPDEDPIKKTKTITHPIDLLQDNSFSDVQFFRSEPVWGMETGLQKCMKNCTGTCLEFGVTNDSMCFPLQ